MRLFQMTARRWMIAAAVAGVACWAHRFRDRQRICREAIEYHAIAPAIDLAAAESPQPKLVCGMYVLSSHLDLTEAATIYCSLSAQVTMLGMSRTCCACRKWRLVLGTARRNRATSYRDPRHSARTSGGIQARHRPVRGNTGKCAIEMQKQAMKVQAAAVARARLGLLILGAGLIILGWLVASRG